MYHSNYCTQKYNLKVHVETMNSEEVSQEKNKNMKCEKPMKNDYNNLRKIEMMMKNPAKRRYVTSVFLFIKILVWGWQNPYLGL